MKHSLLSILMTFLMTVISGRAIAQMSSAVPSVPAGAPTPTRSDYFLDRTLSVKGTQYDRLGHSQWGPYGNPYSQWAAIGVPNLPFSPSSSTYYGFFANQTTDRAFFGLDSLGYNRANALIAFGDDADDRLVFRYDGYVTATTWASKEIATMLANGNVGIATPAPTTTLHIDAGSPPSGAASGVRFENLPTSNQGTYVGIDGSGYVFDTQVPIGGGTGGVKSSCSTLNMVPKVTGPGANLGCSQIYDDGTSVGIGNTGPFNFTVLPSNNVQPGPWTTITSGTLALKVTGVTESLGYLISSDARYKKNVATLTNALDKITSLRGVSYNWNKEANPGKNFTDVPQLGFIAQEAEKVIPEIVYTDDKGYKSVNYTELIPVLVEAIKSQQAQIDDLKRQLMNGGGDAGNGQSAPSKGAGSPFEAFPNPTHGDIVFHTVIPRESRHASILIKDLSGKTVMVSDIDCTGECNTKVTLPVTFNGAGDLICTLVVDGRKLGSSTVTVLR